MNNKSLGGWTPPSGEEDQTRTYSGPRVGGAGANVSATQVGIGAAGLGLLSCFLPLVTAPNPIRVLGDLDPNARNSLSLMDLAAIIQVLYLVPIVFVAGLFTFHSMWRGSAQPVSTWNTIAGAAGGLLLGVSLVVFGIASIASTGGASLGFGCYLFLLSCAAFVGAAIRREVVGEGR